MQIVFLSFVFNSLDFSHLFINKNSFLNFLIKFNLKKVKKNKFYWPKRNNFDDRQNEYNNTKFKCLLLKVNCFWYELSLFGVNPVNHVPKLY